MKPKHKRLSFIALGFASVAVGVSLVLYTLRGNLVFYLTPTELLTTKTPIHKSVRLGGYVKEGSVTYKGAKVLFQVTDFENDLNVEYKGILPALFREGQGVVVQGYLKDNKTFKGGMVLAKHDENYKPPQLEKGMHKKSDNVS